MRIIIQTEDPAPAPARASPRSTGAAPLCSGGQSPATTCGGRRRVRGAAGGARRGTASRTPRAATATATAGTARTSSTVPGATAGAVTRHASKDRYYYYYLPTCYLCQKLLRIFTHLLIKLSPPKVLHWQRSNYSLFAAALGVRMSLARWRAGWSCRSWARWTASCRRGRPCSSSAAPSPPPALSSRSRCVLYRPVHLYSTLRIFTR